MKIEEKTYYIDVTNEWLVHAMPNSHGVKDSMYYEYEETKYHVDGKNVVLDYSKKEKEVAEWLSKTFGETVYLLPRVNFPKEISTADYLFKNEKWDLKELKGCGKRSVDNSVKNRKKQASNFVIDISKSNVNIKDIKLQVKKFIMIQKEIG